MPGVQRVGDQFLYGPEVRLFPVSASTAEALRRPLLRSIPAMTAGPHSWIRGHVPSLGIAITSRRLVLNTIAGESHVE